MRCDRKSRRGLSLIELLVVMGLMVIALNFGAVLVVTTMRLDQMSAETMHRIARQTQLANMFRDDVAKSEVTSDKWNEFQASPVCLILRQPGDQFIVYQFLDGKLERVSNVEGQLSHRLMPVGSTNGIIEFERQGSVITLRVTEHNKGIAGMRHEISAALGRDLK